MPDNAIEKLLGFGRADRAVRAYAYLTVSFNMRPDVNDVLDCLLPFVLAVVNRDGGAHLVEMQTVVDGLSQFGLKIPVYAIQQLLSRLSARRMLEWNQVAKAFLPTKALAEQAKADTAPVGLSETFNHLEEALARFANQLGVKVAPCSPTWTDALIAFLRSEGAKDAIRTANVKDVLVGNPKEIEDFLIARFVQESESRNPEIFSSIIKVFTGILIEDFISTIQEAGSPTSYRGLNIFYDTSVVLRLLGTSGKLLETATLEMHTTLQGLGCNTYYLEATGAEVQNILMNLESSYSRGKEIYGETSDAIISGEITIGRIKDLIGTFEQRLGSLNVFSFRYDYAARASETKYQIDQSGFAEALKSEAIRNDRGYSAQNAQNDAQVVAVILRLRRGRSARDIAKCQYLFITKNSALQRVARKFVNENLDEYLGLNPIPPVLTVGQITTAAWIAATRKLEEHTVSRELLAACYAAVQPDEAWTQEFARVFDEFRQENQEIVEERAKSMVFLTTMRSNARDESLNQPLVLRKLNIAELFRQAAEADAAALAEYKALQENQRAQLERAQQEAIEAANRQASAIINDEKKRAENFGPSEERKRQLAETERRLQIIAERVARIAVVLMQVTITGAFIVALVADLLGLWPTPSWKRWTVVVVLGSLTVLHFLDSVGVRVVHTMLEQIRRGMADLVFRSLHSLLRVSELDPPIGPASEG